MLNEVKWFPDCPLQDRNNEIKIKTQGITVAFTNT